jgi:hypothetical protein
MGMVIAEATSRTAEMAMKMMARSFQSVGFLATGVTEGVGCGRAIEIGAGAGRVEGSMGLVGSAGVGSDGGTG